jgi:transcriptional regulator with XRE-family HTH domain
MSSNVDVKQIFGKNVKLYRKGLKLSQEQFAEKLGITAKHLGTIERGVNFVSAELLEKLCRRLGVSASALFYSQEEISDNDNLLAAIDRVIETELFRVVDVIKTNIRRGGTCPSSSPHTNRDRPVP